MTNFLLDEEMAGTTGPAGRAPLDVLAPALKHLKGKHDQSTHGRGGGHSTPTGDKPTGGNAGGKFSAWGDRAPEIEQAQGTGPKEKILREVLYPSGAVDSEDVRHAVEEHYRGYLQAETQSQLNDAGFHQDDPDYKDLYAEYYERNLQTEIAHTGHLFANSAQNAYFQGPEAEADFDQVYGLSHTGTTRDGKTVTLRSRVNSVGSSDDAIQVGGYIEDGEGLRVGGFVRTFTPSARGGIEVEHELLSIRDEYQGTGFGSAFIRQSENYYISHGIDTVKVHAALERGGYMWAKSGFDWDSEPTNHEWSKDNVVEHMHDYRRRHSAWLTHPDGAPLSNRISAVINRLETLDLSHPDYPTPSEIAGIGYRDGMSTWAGKEIMSGTNWFGVKELRPEGRRMSDTERKG